LEEVDVFEEEDDLEDDEGVVEVLESEVSAKRFDDRISEGKDTSVLRLQAT
jgi:hypothetical protein